ADEDERYCARYECQHALLSADAHHVLHSKHASYAYPSRARCPNDFENNRDWSGHQNEKKPWGPGKEKRASQAPVANSSPKQLRDDQKGCTRPNKRDKDSCEQTYHCNREGFEHKYSGNEETEEA